MSYSQAKTNRLKGLPSKRPTLTMKKVLWRILWTVLTTGIAFIILYPLIVKVCLSFMVEKDLYDPTVRYIAKNFTFDNYKLIFKLLNFPEAFKNTFLISLLTSLLQLISCTFVGYGFARFNFPLKKLWFGLVILTLIVPPQAMMVPFFMHFRFFDVGGIYQLITGTKGLKMLDSFWPFLLLGATANGMKNGLYIYLTRQFFRGFPMELEEAAQVDGAGMFKTFYRIMLPNAVPTMITVFLFSFVWQWNDLFYSNLFLNNTKVLSVSLSSLGFNVSQHFAKEAGIVSNISPSLQSMMVNTGSLFVIVPLIIIYLFAQRYFVEGIERAGIVG